MMARQPAPDPPPYAQAVAELLRRYGNKIRPGRLCEVQIIHEADCPLPRGLGACTCTTVEARLVEPIDPATN